MYIKNCERCSHICELLEPPVLTQQWCGKNHFDSVSNPNEMKKPSKKRCPDFKVGHGKIFFGAGLQDDGERCQGATGLTFLVDYYNESGFDEPELILRHISHELDMGYLAELKVSFLEAIINSEIELDNEELIHLAIHEYDEGTPDNRDIHYSVNLVDEDGEESTSWVLRSLNNES